MKLKISFGHVRVTLYNGSLIRDHNKSTCIDIMNTAVHLT